MNQKTKDEWDKDKQALKDEFNAIPNAIKAMGNNVWIPHLSILGLVAGIVYVITKAHLSQ